LQFLALDAAKSPAVIRADFVAISASLWQVLSGRCQIESAQEMKKHLEPRVL
jgi:hypothetical protein